MKFNLENFRDPRKIFYYIKNYWREYWHSHKLTLLDCLHLWWIIEA